MASVDTAYPCKNVHSQYQNFFHCTTFDTNAHFNHHKGFSSKQRKIQCAKKEIV